MATSKKPVTPIITIDRMVSAEKISTSKLEDVFTDLDVEQIREWADAIVQFVDTYEAAKEAFETWQYAEGRDEKAEAREELLSQLEQVVSDSYTFDDLPEIPELGLSPTDSGTEDDSDD